MLQNREQIEVIDCRAERGRKSCIIVTESGEITYHSEADGYSPVHRGLQVHKEVLTLDSLKSHPYAKDYIYEVELV